MGLLLLMDKKAMNFKWELLAKQLHYKWSVNLEKVWCTFPYLLIFGGKKKKNSKKERKRANSKSKPNALAQSQKERGKQVG
jgi:hypothetical protein